MGYREEGHKVYGTKCEWEGCGWDDAACDAHHISYQEHNRLETEMRAAVRNGNMERFARLYVEAREKGFMVYERIVRQLAKDDRTTNLAILCPNHHRLVHTRNMGLEILDHIPPRK